MEDLFDIALGLTPFMILLTILGLIGHFFKIEGIKFW